MFRAFRNRLNDLLSRPFDPISGPDAIDDSWKTNRTLHSGRWGEDIYDPDISGISWKIRRRKDPTLPKYDPRESRNGGYRYDLSPLEKWLYFSDDFGSYAERKTHYADQENNSELLKMTAVPDESGYETLRRGWTSSGYKYMMRFLGHKFVFWFGIVFILLILGSFVQITFFEDSSVLDAIDAMRDWYFWKTLR
jgi:hypothetical protein